MYRKIQTFKKKIMKRDSFESSVKATEVARLLGSKSMTTSSYITIDDVLVRVSNHYPVFYNLNEYNDLDSLKGIVFVFVGENADKYCSQLEDDYDYRNMYVETVCLDQDDNDFDYLMSTIKRKINKLK